MTDQQSTPLSAEDESWRDEDIYRRVKNGNQLGPMQRSRIIEIMDAARERPSALDDTNDAWQDDCKCWHICPAPRLTEPDAGGHGHRIQYPSLCTGCEHLAAAFVASVPAWMRATPDTTEPDAGEGVVPDDGTIEGAVATTRSIQRYTTDGVRDALDRPTGPMFIPDTTEATLRAFLDGLYTSGHPMRGYSKERRLGWDEAIATVRAALQQPAVKPTYIEVRSTQCHAGSDGDCSWPECPQLRDGEPRTTGRHCPLDRAAVQPGGGPESLQENR